MRLFTFLFSILLILIVFLADLGYLTDFFAFFENKVSCADKVGHFFLFGSLTFCINLLLKARRIEVFSFSVFLGSILMGAIMTVEECSQIFIASRHFEWLDLLSNYAGIISFSFLVPIFAK